MTLEMMKELFGVTNIGEEEVSNVKCMHVGGRGGLTVIAYHYCGPTGGRGGPSTAGPRFRNLARGRGHSSPAAGSPCHGPIEGRSPTRPRYPCPTEGRGGPSPTAPPPVAVLPEGRGCFVVVDDNGLDDEGPMPPLVSSSPFSFSQKHRRFFSSFFLINAADL
jgi:hypothetical protein